VPTEGFVNLPVGPILRGRQAACHLRRERRFARGKRGFLVASESKAVAAKESQSAAVKSARRASVKVFFDDHDLDFYLTVWPMGAMTYGCSVIGEVMAVATRIDEKDLQSWVREWDSMSKRLEAWAKECDAKGQRVSARDAYLRSMVYHRTSMIAMRLDDARYRPAADRLAELFDHAARLHRPQIERVSIPFERAPMLGYFLRATGVEGRRPTVIAFGGGEVFVQDTFLEFGAAQAGPERGYNVLLVDLPGQGVTPYSGIYHRPDTEVPVGALIDYLQTRPEVDAKKIALFGQSLGGYLVTRAAAFEHRIAAAGATTPLYDFHALVRAFTPAVLLDTPRFANAKVGELYGMHTGAQDSVLVVLEKLAWSWGTDTLADLFRKFEAWRFDAASIQCPYFAMLGTGEAPEFGRQTRIVYEAVKAPKRIRTFTQEEGADAHVQGNNFRLSSEVFYGWLDELFSNN
jgi:pimeloyl-ACP methyl ester carboxylesterase